MINFLEGIFHGYEYLEKMRSEGGGQFHSEFEDFTKRAGIQWKPSSAYYAQSNGRIERSIGIVKDLLSKTLRSGESFRDAWFSLQNTPGSSEVLSHARLFYRRIVRDPKLPQLQDDLDEGACRGFNLSSQRQKIRKEK